MPASASDGPGRAALARLAAWDAAYRLRLKRRRLLWRALRSRRDLRAVADRSATISRDDILLFATTRNEAERLPFFLRHYRALGVNHFLIVDNASDDGSLDLLRDQSDVSVWRCCESYRASRFGMDWLNGLLMRHGHGHWCLTVDADELLLLPADLPASPQAADPAFGAAASGRIPAGERSGLRGLTGWLDRRGVPMMAALMLDLYPQGPLSRAHCAPGEDPTRALGWFDSEGYSWEHQPRFGNISIRGGPRKRAFFAQMPERAPHLHKTPLIRWHWRYAYVSSTHVALPRRLNSGFDARLNLPTGVLLHNKFLDQVIDKSREEKQRREHFTHAEHYDSYYDGIVADPVLWNNASQPFTGWRALEALGLMTRGDWNPPG